MILRYIGLLLVIAAVWLAAVKVVHGAEQPRPYQWALSMQLPGKPAEVRWLFDSETACGLDLASSANAAPRGTRFKCERANASSGKRL